MILCFSVTGNSRYIARRIAEALPDKVVDLNTKIKENDNSPIHTGCDVIVVAPTYAWRIPQIVSDCISKTELISAERIWFVMDCGGEIGNAARYNCRLAEQKHLRYMGTAQIVMPENYIAMFGAPQTEEARKIVERAEPDIVDAIARINEGQPFSSPRNNLYYRFMSGPVNPIFHRFFVKAKAFQADNTCIGCGQCVKNCPMNNIKLKDRKPIWGKECTHCMACICYCPTEAIEYGKKSIGKPRYHFEQLKIR
jgi:NAD-dependent dihydropyrimidine dehydrogenase PreA subunit